MSKLSRRLHLRERVKLGLRLGAHKSGIAIGRDPYVNRLVRTLEHRGVDTVLDIGANVGQFARLLRSAGFLGNIVSAEPLAEAFGELAKRSRKDPRWEAINSAVGAAPGTATINVSANSYSSSLLPIMYEHLHAAPDSKVIGTEEVALTTVAEIVAKRGLRPGSTLLKVDTQGFEREVLEGAGSLIDHIDSIQLELSFVELYEGQDLFNDVLRKMHEHGLELWSLETGISDDVGRLLQCDGLFVRQGSIR